MVVERGCARLAQGQRVPDKGGQGPLWGGRAVPAEECLCVTRRPGPRGAAPRSGQHAVPGGPARSSAAEGLPAARRQPSPKLPAPETRMTAPLALALAGAFADQEHWQPYYCRPHAAAHSAGPLAPSGSASARAAGALLAHY